MAVPKPTLRAGLTQRVVPPSLEEELERRGARIHERKVDYDELFAVVENAWLEVPLGEEWIAAYRFVIRSGHPLIAEVRVFPRDGLEGRPAGTWSAEWLGVAASVPENGITSRLLRAIRSSHTRHLAEIVEDLRRRGQEGLLKQLGLHDGEQEEAPAKTPRRGQRGRNKLFYARLARDYTRIAKRPVKTLAEKRRLSVERVRAMVYRARELGLLTRRGDGQQGQAGGALTAKAEALLRRKRRRRL